MLLSEGRRLEATGVAERRYARTSCRAQRRKRRLLYFRRA